MKNFFGPFLQGEDGYWHWRRECKNFPDNPYAKIIASINFPDEIELCQSCNSIDNDECSKKRMTMIFSNGREYASNN